MRENLNAISCGGRIHHKKMDGRGMGSVLLAKGGAGVGSSYPSLEEYKRITGNGLSHSNSLFHSNSNLGEKLKSLSVKPLVKKPHNIRFD